MILKSSITLAVLVASALTGNAQYVWTPYENNPVIAFNFDATSTYMFRPSVLKKDGAYHMWYGKQVGLTQGSPRSIGYAVSQDGIAWELRNLFAVEPSGSLGTFDEIYATNPTVLSDGDTLRMWYSGAGNLADGIGYAWSVNGEDWIKVRGSRAGGSVMDRTMDAFALDGIVSPTAVKKDGQFHLWYQKLVSSDGRSRIGYARSDDGINWTLVPGRGIAQSVVDVGSSNAFDASQIWWPWVVFNEHENTLEMWYQGIDSPAFGGVPRLGCARSGDGITWEKIPGNGDAGACQNSLAQPGIILEDGIYKMWYTLTTNATPQNDEIGYATSDPMPTSTRRDEVPNSFTSLSVYPNPFSLRVSIEINLSRPSSLQLTVLDLLGRIVYSTAIPPGASGPRALNWEGNRNDGSKAVPGTYLIKIRDQATGFAEIKAVHLIR